MVAALITLGVVAGMWWIYLNPGAVLQPDDPTVDAVITWLIRALPWVGLLLAVFLLLRAGRRRQAAQTRRQQARAEREERFAQAGDWLEH